MPMPFADLEIAYEQLAVAIDRAGPRHEALFLAKLVLLLVQKSGDLAGFSADVATALKDLPKE